MELWIYNQYADQRETMKVSDESVSIGRDDANDVVLRSPFVSRRHARIFREAGLYYVESLGLNEVVVANKPLPHKARRRVEFGDEIRIGEFSLMMMEPAARRIQAASRAATPRKRVVDLEQEIHSELLAKLNLRVTGQSGEADEKLVGLIRRNLSELVQEALPRVDAEMTEYLAREYLWRCTASEIARRGTGKLMYSSGFEHAEAATPQQEEALARMVGDIVGHFPLRLRPHTLKEDLAMAESDFPNRFKAMDDRLTDDLRTLIVRRMISKEIEDVVLGYGPLQDLLELPNVNEIMVVGKDRIYIEKDGVVQNTGRSFFSDEIVLSIIERIINPVGRRIDRSSPLVDARLPDGSRVNAVINPLSLSGPTLTIRKFARIPFTADDLVERGTLSEGVAAFLKACVLGRKNVLISGGTGSGKTTTLNVLGSFIPAQERIITIEDSAELHLPQEHLVRMETRPANVEGRGAYNIRDLVRNALRMRPDRLIVGEVRGPEALDMLQAMNTGHDGSLTTIHANSPADSLLRLETMVLMAVEMPVRAIREQATAALDVIVQMARFPDGRRRVTHISEIAGIDPETSQVIVEDIFAMRGRPGKTGSDLVLRHTGYIPQFAEELIEKNYLGVEAFT
jgi:Flp pilus assembly CpaF family ATPase